AFQVTVRNKKRVEYTYEITVKVKGEWLVGEEKKTFKGNLDLAEFLFGELDDLQIEAKLTDDKELLHQDKQRIRQDMKMFLKPIREKLLEFEAKLKESSWKRSMMIALNAKNKMKIINGEFPKPSSDSVNRALWERNNDMIIS
ncbi:activator of HSP90 ATPase, partial [Tanacetum coccineum]